MAMSPLMLLLQALMDAKNKPPAQAGAVLPPTTPVLGLNEGIHPDRGAGGADKNRIFGGTLRASSASPANFGSEVQSDVHSMTSPVAQQIANAIEGGWHAPASDYYSGPHYGATTYGVQGIKQVAEHYLGPVGGMLTNMVDTMIRGWQPDKTWGVAVSPTQSYAPGSAAAQAVANAMAAQGGLAGYGSAGAVRPGAGVGTMGLAWGHDPYTGAGGRTGGGGNGGGGLGSGSGMGGRGNSGRSGRGRESR